MHKYRIDLVTFRDVQRFVDVASRAPEPVYLTDGTELKVSAHSILGALYSLEWNDLYVVSDYENLYTLFKQFIID